MVHNSAFQERRQQVSGRKSGHHAHVLVPACLTLSRPFVSVDSCQHLAPALTRYGCIEVAMAIKFRGVDFIEIETLLTDDERLVRNTARAFIEDNLIPIIEECNREGRFPRELVKPMAELGFFGDSLQGYGCAGMSNVEYGLVMQELERGDSGVRSFVSVQSALVMYPIFAFGSDEQKNTWLPALRSGEKLGCFGLTEPDFGSNPGGMRTRARKAGKEYVLNGEKMWIT